MAHPITCYGVSAMIMSWIWTGSMAIAVVAALILGRGDALAAAIPHGAQAGITLAISIAGSVCLWTGVGKLMERAGLTGLLSKLLSPLLGKIFPSFRKDKTLACSLSANVCANFLGLGNAATPMGIQATKRMALRSKNGAATDEMCRLIVLNTASIQLIPANVAAIRASLGASQPFDILLPVWITSFCSAGLGLGMAALLGRMGQDA